MKEFKPGDRVWFRTRSAAAWQKGRYLCCGERRHAVEKYDGSIYGVIDGDIRLARRTIDEIVADTNGPSAPGGTYWNPEIERFAAKIDDEE